MRSLGDKISSTIVAQHAQVPCMDWSGKSVSRVVKDAQGLVTVEDADYNLACVKTWQEALESAKKIGFPVMIKASEGGGGKGIRKVESELNFENTFTMVMNEVPGRSCSALSDYGLNNVMNVGSPIFIMKLAGKARHLEVQVLADQYNNAISLFGRDCSVQRRHQKIIEEAPVTVAKADTFEKMEQSAVRLAKLVGYVSAGTVEVS